MSGEDVHDEVAAHIRNVGVTGHPGAKDDLDLVAEAEAGYDPAKVGPNLVGLTPHEARAWKAFGLAVLVLCDSPFAEWNVSAVPGFTQAGVQIRALADRYGVSR